MQTINLGRPWTYRTPQKTIDYAAGEHEVFNYIAEQAEAEGVITASGTGDPLDGNLDSLAAHLATVDDPAEVERLIAAETGGKTRSGALKLLNDRKDALTA